MSITAHPVPGLLFASDPPLRHNNTKPMGGICMFQNKVIIITGGAGGIGKCITEEFEEQGTQVCVIDCAEGPHYVGDIAEKGNSGGFRPDSH